MTYEVRITRQAVLDIRSLYEEKRVEASHHAATWFIGLEAAIFSLENMPHRGVRTAEDVSLRHLLYGRKPYVYRIIYTIDEQSRQVNVAQIRHGAREPLAGR